MRSKAEPSLSALPAVLPWKAGLKGLHTVAGFRTAALHCGLKRAKGNPDLALIYAEEPGAGAGVFTTNRVCAAPVRLSRAHLAKSKGAPRAIVINAGNANACTGEQGAQDAARMAASVAELLNLKPTEVLVCSTGLIGQLLPMPRVEQGIAKLCGMVAKKPKSGDFARAIMTTDLVPKPASAQIKVDDATVSFAGACKGSGMIMPNMATMLGFIVTDANIAPNPLQAALSQVTERTFNCLTVDGDTSTNDTVLLLASRKAAHPPITQAKGKAFAAFVDGLYAVCDDLATQIADDGEGAEHLVRVFVLGAESPVACKQIALTIANSPLVKTAIAGKDPNWGRILAAAGRAGVEVDAAQCELHFEIQGQAYPLFKAGRPLAFDGPAISKAMDARELNVVLRTGPSKHAAMVRTCDLTHGYITINAEYHT
jgi:glutamate N-acetyltransferase/amino-acid N-acetyltransferase